MPVVLRIGPYSFLFYSLENDEPPHIHIRRDRNIAKFWLDPVDLASQGGYPLHEVTRFVTWSQAINNCFWRLGMLTSAAPQIEFNASATSASFDDGMLRVHLFDGREIAIPLEYFPRLRDATAAELNRYEIVGDGYGIHWDHLDEHLSVKGLMRLH